jgi:GNAT superfamily N-acetyltransferase
LNPAHSGKKIIKRTNIEFSLRPATDGDIEFIFDLRVKTMKPFFMDTYGWSDTEERIKAADELNHARIIMIGHKEIGVIKIIPRPHELHLHQMQILPEFQKKGIGKELIRQIIIQSGKALLPNVCMINLVLW